ncbi:MAG: tetratricopeptide repeat protein [Bacteroidota bacterium]
MRILILYFVLTTLCALSHAQNSNESFARIIDSLETKLKTAKNDTNKVIILNDLAHKYLETGIYDKALVLFNSSITLSKKMGYKKGLSVAYNNLGVLYDYRADYIKSIDYYNMALALRKESGDLKGQSACYSNLAIVYEYLGKFPEALNCLYDALRIDEKLNDKNGIGILHINMGSVYAQQGKYKESEACFKKALELFTSIDAKDGIAYAESGLGMIFMQSGKETEAEEHVKRSKAIFEEFGDKQNVSGALINLGQIYVSSKKLNDAEKVYKESLKLNLELEDKRNLSFSYLGLGQVYMHKRNFPRSKMFLDSAIYLAESIGCIECLRDDYSAYAHMDSSSSNFKGAFINMKKFMLYRDSLMNETNNKKSSQAKLQYDFDKKAISDSLRNKEVKEQEAFRHDQEIKQQKLYSYGAVLGFILMLVIAGVSFRAFKQKQKDNIVIEHQKAMVEEKQKEILDSINYAERIQRSFLATEELLQENLNQYFVFFQPKDVVSGDFYWGSKLSNGNFALATADSTGHGVPGAIMSILNISCLENAIKEGCTSPADILNHTRTNIIERLKKDGSAEGGKDGMDCSLICLNPTNSQLNYAAANNPIWVVRDNVLIELTPDKMPVGKHDKDQNSFAQHSFDLKKGDVIYALTDGMADQFGGPKGKKFMYKKLKEFLVSISGLSMTEQKDKLDIALNNWKGGLEQVDDVCVVGIRI